MFTIPLTVREDVLAAFEASLAPDEGSDDVICALIGLESECRTEDAFASVDGRRDMSRFTTEVVHVEVDPDTHEALARAVRPGEDAGALVTALMLDSLLSGPGGLVGADKPLAAA